MTQELEEQKYDSAELEDMFNRFISLSEENFEVVFNKLDSIDNKLGSIDNKLGSIDNNLDEVSSKIECIMLQGKEKLNKLKEISSDISDINTILNTRGD
jgi:chromosome segregation ATPase